MLKRESEERQKAQLAQQQEQARQQAQAAELLRQQQAGKTTNLLYLCLFPCDFFSDVVCSLLTINS